MKLKILISYQKNFIGNHEYETTTVTKIFGSPLPRLLVMHLGIIFGGMIQAPAIAIIGFKTIIDAITHLHERRGFTLSAKDVDISVEDEKITIGNRIVVDSDGMHFKRKQSLK